MVIVFSKYWPWRRCQVIFALKVQFSDPQLQRCYEINLAAVIGSSETVRQVCALIAVHDFFQMVEGPHSVRVHEILDRLLSPGVRSGLRDWYRQCGSQLNASATVFRDQLNILAGERLELEAAMPGNPS
jgi:hypothetical protein